MSKTALAETALQARLRDKLNVENVKLWLAPFYDPTSQSVSDEEVLVLASRYATEIGTPEAEVAQCLFTLQQNALERLAERDLLKETGISTIRIKLSGFPNADDLKSINRLQINLVEATGKDLKKNIADLVSAQERDLKIICSGRVVDEAQSLESQGIKNGCQIMVLCLSANLVQFQEQEDSLRQLEETKDSANFLASMRETSESINLQVADQSGKQLDLPPEEKRSLAVALALHEKGRAALKHSAFSKALIFLLEADNAYSQCRSSLLDRVDNYGILHLDIAWCYLCLQAIAELPQVDARLKKSESSLKNSYGDNMERVIALKGTTGWEAVLFVRLHLLQGIVAYHQGHSERAKFIFSQVQEEIRRLQVSDDSLAEVIAMGYSSEEARMALRANYGDVSGAVNWILRKREENLEVERQNKDVAKQKKLEKRLGKCQNGQNVNYFTWKSLKEMGFNGLVAAAALRKSNNDINDALLYVNDQNFIVEVVTTLSRTSLRQDTSAASPSSSSPPVDTNSETANEIGASGSETGTVHETLDQLEDSWLADSPSEEMLTEEELHRSEKAYQALKDDSCSEADYVDLGLHAEVAYLNQYKDLLQM